MLIYETNIMLVVYFDNLNCIIFKDVSQHIYVNNWRFNEYQSFNDRKALHLDGSSAFLHFEASEAQDIGTTHIEMHHEREKALDLQGLSANIKR